MRYLSRFRTLHYCLGVLFLAALAVIIVEANTYYVRDLLYLDVYGSKPHRIPCEDWPTPSEVRQILDEHSDIVRRIEMINPGGIKVEINNRTCPGKADIRIFYATAVDRQEIELRLEDKKYFLGVPYMLRNS